jgi:hypothetical protein
MRRTATFAVASVIAIGVTSWAQEVPAAHPGAAQAPQQVVSQPVQTPGHDSVAMLTVSAGPNHSQQWTIETFHALQHTTVTVLNSQTNAGESYSGVPLIDLLGPLGAPRGSDLRGKALADYVVATGSDGFRAVLALAEIEPDFHPCQVLVADAMNGEPLDAERGPFQTGRHRRPRPARSVHNLASVQLKTAGSGGAASDK